MMNLSLATVAALSIALIYLGYDLILCQCIIFLVIKLEILQYYASKVGDFESEFNTDKKQHLLLLKIIKIHTETFAFSNLCNEFYRTVVFLTYSSNSICLCAIVVAMKIVSFFTFKSIFLKMVFRIPIRMLQSLLYLFLEFYIYWLILENVSNPAVKNFLSKFTLQNGTESEISMTEK